MKRHRVVILAGGILLLLTACGTTTGQPGSPAAAAALQEGTSTGMTGISVSGRGEVIGTPDTLSVSLGVSVTRATVSEAIDVAAQRATGLIDAMRDLGVADDDMQTSNYSVYPEYDYSDNNAPKITGYRVDNTLSVKIRNLDMAGEILDAAASAAGDDVRVNGVSFSLDDNDALLVAARAAAWEDARTKAEQLAELAGVTLGAPLTISESVANFPQPFFDRAAAGAFDEATPIQAGQETVTVDLSVTFEIGS